MVAVGNGIGEGFREGGAEVEADAAGGEGTAGQLVRDQLHRWADILEVARHVERQLHLGLASRRPPANLEDRKSTRLNSSHTVISYAVFCLKKKNLVDNENPKLSQRPR